MVLVIRLEEIGRGAGGGGVEVVVGGEVGGGGGDLLGNVWFGKVWWSCGEAEFPGDGDG